MKRVTVERQWRGGESILSVVRPMTASIYVTVQGGRREREREGETERGQRAAHGRPGVESHRVGWQRGVCVCVCVCVCASGS